MIRRFHPRHEPRDSQHESNLGVGRQIGFGDESRDSGSNHGGRIMGSNHGYDLANHGWSGSPLIEWVVRLTDEVSMIPSVRYSVFSTDTGRYVLYKVIPLEGTLVHVRLHAEIL